MSSRILFLLFHLPLLTMLATPLLATHPVHRTFDRFEDFLKGEYRGISLTGDGRLVLAPALVEELSTDEAYIYAAAADSTGAIFLGTGNNGRLFRTGGLGKTGQWASFEEPGVYAVAVDSNNLVYVGTGPDGKIYRLDPEGKPSVFFEPKEKYIWDIEIDSRNNLYVATGPDGIIYKVDTNGNSDTFWDSPETHIISLEWDLNRNLLAGTAPGGLVVRLSPAGRPFVVYDSSLEEARAIRVDRYGNIFAVAISGGPDRTESEPVNNKEKKKPAETEESKVTVAGTEKGSKLEVYRINRNNLTEVLYASDDELAFDLAVRDDGSILIATGNKGRILSVSPKGVPKILVDTPEEQVTRLVQTASGIYAVTSNLGKVFSISPAAPEKGIYESEVIDAGSSALWGTIRWTIRGKATDEAVSIFTRSGNTRDPDRTWSDWEGPYPEPTGSQIGSSPARFLQWKLEYAPKARGTALLSEDNALESLSVSFMQQNLAPKIKSLTVHSAGVAFAKYAQSPSGGIAPGGPGGAHSTSLPRKIRQLDSTPMKTPLRTIYIPGARSFSWEAADPNNDDLLYSVFLRLEGVPEWTLEAEELKRTQYTLDTKSLADGVYRVKIVAADLLSNPPGNSLRHAIISKPFLVANSLPAITWSEPRITGGSATLAFSVTTPASPLYQIEYSIRGGAWQVVFPDDGITDQNREKFEITVENLSKGEHILLVRAVDMVGNIGTSQYRIQIP